MPKVINKKKKRKFKVTTPGQIRDFEILVKNRKFQRYEDVTPQEEDAPANSVAGGGVDMAPNAGPRKPKIFLKRKRLKDSKIDGRTKAYKQTVKRIKERQFRKQQKEVEQRFSQFAAQANPFREETDMSNKKYLETKDNSIEAAVRQSVESEVLRPNDDKPTLTLPKNRYLDAKEEGLEYAAMKTMVEAGPVRPGVAKPAAPPLPRQLKDPKKEKMVGTKSGTKVVDRGDPKYKNAPEHESVNYENNDHDEKDEVNVKVKGLRGRKTFMQFQKKDKEDQDKDPVGNGNGKKKGKKQDDLDRDDEAEATRSKKHPTAEAKKQNLRDRDNEAQATRSKTRPTAEKKEVDVPDTRRTVDAIRAYDRSKDASRDADWDTTHGKKKKGDKEKKYAKKERGEIDKDDPNWKHRDYHTGMHGEETSPLIQATIDELSKKTMGSYVKKASTDAETRMGNLERARGQAAATGQSADVDAKIRAHKPTMARLKSRPKGIARAADKLSKESKESEAGERDVGSSQYLKYTTDLTPGQGITSPQAKKADVAKKIEQQRQRTAATGIDDAHQPGHKPGTPKPVPGIKSLKQKFKANRYAVRQKQARQAIATPKKEDVDLDAIIRKNLPETAVNPMGAPSNAPIGRSVIGDTAPEKVSPVSGSVATQASPSASVPGESGIEKVMDKINRIVKSGHSEKIHDKVIDKDTASAIQSTYAKVNAANQEKMEKVMSKDAAAMEKVSKFSKKNA